MPPRQKRIAIPLNDLGFNTVPESKKQQISIPIHPIEPFTPLIDIGVNLTKNQKNIDEILTNSMNAGVTTLILTGTDLAGKELIHRNDIF